jgi:hypothetical protein
MLPVRPSVEQIVNYIFDEAINSDAYEVILEREEEKLGLTYLIEEDTQTLVSLPNEIAAELFGEIRRRAGIAYQNGFGSLTYDGKSFAVSSEYGPGMKIVMAVGLAD